MIYYPMSVLMNAGIAIPCANDFEDKVFKITKVD